MKSVDMPTVRVPIEIGARHIQLRPSRFTGTWRCINAEAIA